MNGPYTFSTNADAFGIPKALDTEVEYEFDVDGEILIAAVILKRKVNYKPNGDYAPHYKELRIDCDWLSNSTLQDLASEIETDLLAQAADNAYEAKRDREIHRYFDYRANGPMHYEGMPV